MHAPAEAEMHRPLDMGAYARELRSEASSIQLSERKACDKLTRLLKRRWCEFVCCRTAVYFRRPTASVSSARYCSLAG